MNAPVPAPALVPSTFLGRILGTRRSVGTRAATEVAPGIADRGDRIYIGRVYPLEGEASAPTYVYERRVDTQGDGLVSTHVTRDPAGAFVLVESALHSVDYALREYTLHANQLGQRGSIRVEDGKVTFRLADDRGERTKSETPRAPVVTGPTLVGHLVRHFGELLAGETLPVRMAVLDRMETIGFVLQRLQAPEGLTCIRMKASNFLYALAIDPIELRFETDSRKLVSLRGRVPPKVRDGGELKDFDARVEYEFVARSYR